MVAVCRVVIGAQHRAEAPARAGVDHAEEFADGRITRIVIAQHGDPPPIGQFETRDVDGVGGGMGAAGVFEVL